jgi:hypothetical protein
MSFLAVFFITFFVIYCVLGPLLGAEDRPNMKRPEDRTIRPMVGSWFHGRTG